MRRALIPLGGTRGLNGDLECTLVSGRGCITNVSLYENTGTAAAGVHFWDGTSANDQYLLEYTLASGGSVTSGWYHHALPFTEGIYMDIYTGSLLGTMTVWLEHNCEWWLAAPHKAAELEAAAVLAQMAARG